MPDIKQGLLPVLIVFTALTGAAGQEQERGERRMLLEQQNRLTRQVDALEHRQDYLLFLKAVSAADSKYLVVTLSNRTGQLKYKNRVLRNFRFSPGRPRARLREGPVTLTRKSRVSGGYELVFGNVFSVGRKDSGARPKTAVPRLWLGNKDLKAVFAALEEGAPAYLLP